MSDTLPSGLRIDLQRLRDDLQALANIGYHPDDRGIYRQAFSAADQQARRWLVERFEQAGASARVDQAGNVIGRFADADEPALLVGSHVDTVPAGGMFDGALGVLAGLECMRTLRDVGWRPGCPVEVIAFADEEGRFGGMLGAQAVAGKITPDWVEQAHDVAGVRLADALRQQGFDPRQVALAARSPDDLRGFIELHIEQGPLLEKHGDQIGIVTGISGVFKWLVRLVGKAAHAGTSPMDLRSDAFMGLADFAHEIPRIIAEEGTDASRLTVGMVELRPGYPHTVPGEVDFSLVGRDIDPLAMANLALACRKVLSAIARRHHLHFDFEELSWLEPQPCSDEIVAIFRRQAEALGLSYRLMPSGAGHDTQFLAQITRAGMIFVPSVDGVSHAPHEMTAWHDIEAGANLLLHTLLALAGGRR